MEPPPPPTQCNQTTKQTPPSSSSSFSGPDQTHIFSGWMINWTHIFQWLNDNHIYLQWLNDRLGVAPGQGSQAKNNRSGLLYSHFLITPHYLRVSPTDTLDHIIGTTLPPPPPSPNHWTTEPHNHSGTKIFYYYILWQLYKHLQLEIVSFHPKKWNTTTICEDLTLLTWKIELGHNFRI